MPSASMRDIKSEALTGYIYGFLSTAPHPENFIFEILENEDVDEYETLLQFVGSIHKLGGKISIDDFGRLQSTMNESLKANNVIAMNNRLFTLMKDKAIQFHGVRKRIESGSYSTGRNRIQDFMTWTTNYGKPGEEALGRLIRQMDRIGLVNAAMYLYREPIAYSDGDAVQLPETMQLRCVLRSGKLFTIPANRTTCPIAEIYIRDELPAEKLGYVSYPLFCGKYLFGMLVCRADGRLFEIGEFLTFQLSRAIYMNWISTQ